MELTVDYYLVLSALLFTIGAVGLLVRRNPLVMFMCVELMLNAVNLTFVALATELGDIDGQTVKAPMVGALAPTVVEADRDPVVLGHVHRHLVAQPAFPQQHITAFGRDIDEVAYLGPCIPEPGRRGHHHRVARVLQLDRPRARGDLHIGRPRDHRMRVDMRGVDAAFGQDVDPDILEHEGLVAEVEGQLEDGARIAGSLKDRGEPWQSWIGDADHAETAGAVGHAGIVAVGGPGVAITTRAPFRRVRVGLLTRESVDVVEAEARHRRSTSS